MFAVAVDCVVFRTETEVSACDLETCALKWRKKFFIFLFFLVVRHKVSRMRLKGRENARITNSCR